MDFTKRRAHLEKLIKIPGRSLHLFLITYCCVECMERHKRYLLCVNVNLFCVPKKRHSTVYDILILNTRFCFVLFCFVLFFSVKENQFSFIFKFIRAPFGGRLVAINLSYRDFMNDQDFVMQCRSKVVDRNTICLRKLLPSLFIA